VYTLDTNIIIYYFNGEAPILAFLREQTEQGSVANFHLSRFGV